MDITCETLHTELAPASALIQRAGRCARFPGEQGEVWIYPVDNYAPYGREAGEGGLDPAWVKEMKAAWVWLQAHSGTALDFAGEQELVNAVATPRDRAMLEGLREGAPTRAEAIRRVLRGEPPDTRLLVRDADSRLVLIQEAPETLLANPYGATGFSIQRVTLYGMVNEWLAREGEFPWRVMKLEETLPDKTSRGEEEGSSYRWLPVTSTKEVSGARVLVVHPALAGYLPDVGFLAGQGVVNSVPFCRRMRIKVPGRERATGWNPMPNMCGGCWAPSPRSHCRNCTMRRRRWNTPPDGPKAA